MRFTLVSDGSSDRVLLYPLRQLPAFRALEEEMAITLENSGIA